MSKRIQDCKRLNCIVFQLEISPAMLNASIISFSNLKLVKWLAGRKDTTWQCSLTVISKFLLINIKKFVGIK